VGFVHFSSDKESRVTVVGLGRIGLPFALLLANTGRFVYGVDVDSSLINKLNEGITPFIEPFLPELLKKCLGKTFCPTLDLYKAISNSDFIIITFGADLLSNKSTNISLLDFFTKIANYITRKTVILRTTVPIGTTRYIRDFLQKTTGLKESKDFFLSFVPERIVEGKALEEFRSLPIIIGAFSRKGFDKVKKFIKSIGNNKIIRADSPEMAEFIKLIDNSFRNLIFAFSNEVALLAEELKLDGFKIIKMANQDYPRNFLPLPSYGVSGYCLSKDPYIFEKVFSRISKKRGFHSLSFYGRMVNDYLCRHVYNLINYYVEKYKRNVNKIRVLIAGLSYKEDIDDFRYSHGIELLKLLTYNTKFKVSVYDPYLDVKCENSYVRLPDDLQSKVRVHKKLTKAFRDLDVAVFTVKHKEFIKLKNVILKLIAQMRKPAIIIDGWNIFPKLYNSDSDEIVYAGAGRTSV
jgi:nucleotide sugar dehydrogenase